MVITVILHLSCNTSSCSVLGTGYLSNPTWHCKPGGFLDSCWSLVSNGSLETLAQLQAEGISSSSNRGNQQGGQRQNGRPCKQEVYSVPSAISFCNVGFYWEVLPTRGMHLHTPGKVIRTNSAEAPYSGNSVLWQIDIITSHHRAQVEYFSGLSL